VNFSEIDRARKLLGLGEAATQREIKSAYRRLAHHHHPDKHGSVGEKSNEIMKELNRAYKLLMDYCNEYRYSFRREDVSRVYPEEEDIETWRDRWSNSI
jgi:DnaJ-class molecular chaperone